MTTRPALMKLIAEKIELRFTALDADQFADYLIEKAEDVPDGDVDRLTDITRLSLDDLYLAAACAHNDEHAWEEFAARHFAYIKQFARRFLQPPAAVDVADQVIADLWQRGKIARYSGRSTLRTWLGAVVAHAAINVAKSPHGRAAPESPAALLKEDGHADGRPDRDRESSHLLAKLIVEVIGSLSADDKLLLLLHYEQGLSLDQMQRAVGGSRATISRRLRDTRARLWAALDALARRRLGAPAGSLKDGIDLAPLEFDLEAAVGAVRVVDEKAKDIV